MKKISSNWTRAILVCRKCSKKCDGGFGKNGKSNLAKELRKFSKSSKGRKAHIGFIEVGCLKVCPKKAVVTIDTARPDLWHIVPAGSSTEEIFSYLGLMPGNK